MSFSSTNDHNMHDPVRQDPDNYQRIVQWLQQSRFFQIPTTPPTEEGSIGTAVAASQPQPRAPFFQSLPVHNVVGDSVVMAARMLYPIHQSGDRGPASAPGHPPAPRVLTIPLPQVEQTDSMPVRRTRASVALSGLDGSADHQPTGTRLHQSERSRAHHHRPPSSVLAGTPTIVNRAEQIPGQQIQRHLHAALRFNESSRPVVKPVLSDMPPYPGHRWGAHDQDVSCTGEWNIHFACNMIPATSPPLTRMKLARPFGGKLVVIPTTGNQFVSVGDVQKAVVAWMRWEQPHVTDEGLRLTRREIVRTQDGTTMSVEVWVWRGLMTPISETDAWQIIL